MFRMTDKMSPKTDEISSYYYNGFDTMKVPSRLISTFVDINFQEILKY